MDFYELHYQKKPFIIANVWDAGSAVAAQQAGYLSFCRDRYLVALSAVCHDRERPKSLLTRIMRARCLVV